MSRKSTIESLFATKSDSASSSAVADKDRVRTGAISAMGSSLKELTDGARAAARLQEQIDTGANVLALDPSEIDGSMVNDRLPAEIDPSFDALVESMRVSGQQVPILVRPHPQSNGRFQVAYGHRRLRAALLLGVKIKAIVRVLTDSELVIAQGKENLDRHDLSFIEKALFARRLEDQGFERSVIIAALSTDKADLSRYLSVARMIPEPLLQRIGPAAKAGRARWLALAERLGQTKSDSIIGEVLAKSEFSRLDSDSRFQLFFQALAKSERRTKQKARFWTTRTGQKGARIERFQNRTVVTIDDGKVPEFGAFVVDCLDDLFAKFQISRQQEEIRSTGKPQ